MARVQNIRIFVPRRNCSHNLHDCLISFILLVLFMWFISCLTFHPRVVLLPLHELSPVLLNQASHVPAKQRMNKYVFWLSVIFEAFLLVSLARSP